MYMTFLKNLKFTIKLFKKFYLTKTCKDKFLKLFVFKTKYVIDGVTLERIEDNDKLFILCHSDKYARFNNHVIDSGKKFLNMCETNNVNFSLCYYCHKPIILSDAAVRIRIKKKGNRLKDEYQIFCNFKEADKYLKRVIRKDKKRRRNKNG